MPSGIYQHKGNRKGAKHSEESRQKMSIAKTGKKLPPFTEDHKRKIGLANKGRKQSKETIAELR